MQNSYFRNPPIIEVICGIQFDCTKFNFALADRFYNNIKDIYPNTTENPPLPFTFDKLCLPTNTAMPNKPIFVRFFFINEQNTKLIQLQNGRLLFNWRKTEGVDTIYPKFEALFQEFRTHWQTFLKIVTDSKAEAVPTQLELTYIDHIISTDFDENFWAFPKIFNFFAKNPLGPNIDNANFSISIPIDELCGHLHMSGHTGIRNADKKAVFMLETTVRGINKSTTNIESWFDKAHLTVNNTFQESITEDAKKAWGFTE